MTACGYEPYALPKIDFVGGETEKLVYHVYFKNTSQPFSLVNCRATFALVEFGNRRGDPIWTKEMTAVTSEDGTENVLYLTLSPSDTINLSGKFIYQITIKDTDGTVEIPKQGIFYITNTIDKESALA